MLIAEEDSGYPISSGDRELGFRELKEGEKGRREEPKKREFISFEKKSQNSHKFAHNEPHTGVCSSLG